MVATIAIGATAATEITPDNAAKLSPVWSMSTEGQYGRIGIDTSVRDGVIYFSADYARVSRSMRQVGKHCLVYEPEYEQGLSAMLCCGPIHRGWH